MPKLRINNFRLDSSEDSEGELDIAVGTWTGKVLNRSTQFSRNATGCAVASRSSIATKTWC